jgi:hypothetical protein
MHGEKVSILGTAGFDLAWSYVRVCFVVRVRTINIIKSITFT